MRVYGRDAIDEVVAKLASQVFGEVSARVKRSRELKEAAFDRPAKSKA